MLQEKNLYQSIGRRVKRLREQLGLSQEALADLMEYKSAATVSHFESGSRKISIVDLQRLAGIFGVPLESLIGEAKSSEAEILQSIKLRANVVRPRAQKIVAEFLSFSQNQTRQPVEVPGPSIASSRPGHVAKRVLQLVDWNEPPVAPRSVAEQLNIPVFDWDFPNEVSGIFVTNEGGACIGVNRNHPNVRQRFTIAHELGHQFYRTDEIVIDFSSSEIQASYNDEETKANQFAADLLMPKEWIERDYSTPLELPSLANKYRVSEEALWYRLVTLKLVAN